MLYFTGHGLKDDNGRLYLAMKNTRRDNLRFTGLSAELIDEAMTESPSRQKVLILDCCYSGAYQQRAKSDSAVHTLEKFEGRARTVLTASDSTQYAFEGDTIHGEAAQSVFTRHLVAGLRDGGADLDHDGDITLDELYGYVYEPIGEPLSVAKPRELLRGPGQRLYVVSVNAISAIDTGRLTVAPNPIEIAGSGGTLTADGKVLYTLSGKQFVAVDTDTSQVVQRLDVDWIGVTSMVVSVDGFRVYSSDIWADGIQVVDTAGNKLIGAIQIPG